MIIIFLMYLEMTTMRIVMKKLDFLSSPNPLIEIETDDNDNVLFEDPQKEKKSRFVESSLPTVTIKGK